MGYMTVEEQSSTVLRLKRSPGIRSWALLVGLVSVGVAAACYSSDSIPWKIFYVAGCLFVALQNMEEWEEAVFDKNRNLIELKTFSLYALLLTVWNKGQETVVLDLTQLCDICVQEEKVRYLGKGYQLILRLAAGFSYPLTQSATLGGRDDVEVVAALLKHFLCLDKKQERKQQQQQQQQQQQPQQQQPPPKKVPEYTEEEDDDDDDDDDEPEDEEEDQEEDSLDNSSDSDGEAENSDLSLNTASALTLNRSI